MRSTAAREDRRRYASLLRDKLYQELVARGLPKRGTFCSVETAVDKFGELLELHDFHYGCSPRTSQTTPAKQMAKPSGPWLMFCTLAVANSTDGNKIHPPQALKMRNLFFPVTAGVRKLVGVVLWNGTHFRSFVLVWPTFRSVAYGEKVEVREQCNCVGRVCVCVFAYTCAYVYGKQTTSNTKLTHNTAATNQQTTTTTRQEERIIIVMTIIIRIRYIKPEKKSQQQ